VYERLVERKRVYTGYLFLEDENKFGQHNQSNVEVLFDFPIDLIKPPLLFGKYLTRKRAEKISKQYKLKYRITDFNFTPVTNDFGDYVTVPIETDYEGKFFRFDVESIGQ